MLPVIFRAFLLALPVVLCGCKTPNHDGTQTLGGPVTYTPRRPGDRSAFVLPLIDDRHPDVLPSAQGSFPIRYDGDSHWRRPVTEMVDELLRNGLAENHLFAKVVDQATPQDLVIRPTLVAFATGAMEVDTGGRSLAEVAVRVEVFGPPAEDGKRPLLHDQVYGERQLSNVAMVPVSPYVLAGRAAQVSLLRAFTGIEQSGVGCTKAMPQPGQAMPELGLPAPAPTPAAPPSTGGDGSR